MHRFNITPDSVHSGLAVLSPRESHHALSVLRVKPGDVVELLDGKGSVFRGIVAGSEKGQVTVSVSAGQPSASPTARATITLAASVLKPERMELLVQKACELGASEIVPLITERTVVRLSMDRWRKKAERWRKIAAETCKQCGQSRLPQIGDVVDFKKFVKNIASYDLSLIPTLAVPVKSLQYSLDSHRLARSVLVLIGPEGDFSPGEVKNAVLSGAEPVGLGPWVLRSETAALFVLSIIGFFYNN